MTPQVAFEVTEPYPAASPHTTEWPENDDHPPLPPFPS